MDMPDRKAMLFVDDEKIILQSLKNQIKKHFGNRYLYEFAESGEEALEAL
jgi:CheY-like chemotaxis protein